MKTNKADSIGVGELIARLKHELLEEQKGVLPLFAVGQVELEISFTVQKNDQGNIDLKVVQIGRTSSREEVQRIKITLEPLSTVDELRNTLTEQEKTEINKSLVREAKLE